MKKQVSINDRALDRQSRLIERESRSAEIVAAAKELFVVIMGRNDLFQAAFKRAWAISADPAASVAAVEALCWAMHPDANQLDYWLAVEAVTEFRPTALPMNQATVKRLSEENA
jgi:hypothetical protein